MLEGIVLLAFNAALAGCVFTGVSVLWALAGGYLIGLAIAVFTHFGSLPVEVRLFAITGFLGALTTFSTFSSEVVTLLIRGQLGWAITTAGVHLAGSLTMTWLGLQSLRPFIRT